MAYEALNGDQRAGTTLNGKTSYTIDQAAAQLDRSGERWTQLGQPLTITYAYRASAPATMPGDSAGFQEFSATQITATETALALWAQLANIHFVRVGTGTYGSDAYADNATILFGDYTSGQKGADAFAFMPGSRAAASDDGDVWINSSYSYNSSVSVRGGYGFQTLLHEIGHTLGLSHPSDYDASDTSSSAITYTKNASYGEDSTEYSIMSYFDISDTGGTSYASAPTTPLIDDIAAVQRLYGANTATNGGDTVYGDATGISGLAAQGSTSGIWGTIWDGGGVDTLDFSSYTAAQKIDLHGGAFSDVEGGVGNLSIAQGVTIENATGGSGNDMLVGNNADNILRGGAGDDVMTGNVGADTYVGGDGSDRAVLNGNASDYLLLTGAAGDVLEARNGSGNQYVDASTETIQFRNGTSVSLANLSGSVASGVLAGETVAIAPLSGPSYFAGTSGVDRLVVDGNVSDYTLSRVQATAGQASQGDFVLTAKVGGNVIDVGEAIDTVQFGSGQYLALHDVPAYVSGSAFLALGGGQNDVLYQTRTSGFQFLYGGDGDDAVYLNGNVNDYRAQSFDAYATGSNLSIFNTVNGAHYSGTALVATNGSGELLIDPTVETVHFRNGQALSYADLMKVVAPGHDGAVADELHFATDVTSSLVTDAVAVGSNDRVLLNGKASDYTLTRFFNGDFILTGHGGGSGNATVDIDQAIKTVQFDDGQYLSLVDVPRYVSGNAVFVTGTSANDILFAATSGDQYLNGGGGTDNAYINGNVIDYTLQHYSNGNSSGYELVARNGSGNLYVDTSTEVIHFRDGQYLAFNDLPAYIAHDSGF